LPLGLALLAAGMLGDVATALEAMPEPQRSAAKIEWEYSQSVQRNKALVLALATALVLSDEQLDDLFVQASKL